MRYSPLNNSLFSENRKRFVGLIPGQAMAVFLSAENMPRNGDQCYPFRQQSDFFYLTGIEQENTALILFPDCPNPLWREVLFISAFDAHKATWEGHKLSPDEARQLSGISQVTTMDQFNAVLQEVMNYSTQVFLNNTEYIKYSAEIEHKNLRFARQLKEKYPLHLFQRAAPLLEKLRVVKSAAEIELLKTASDITGKAFGRLLRSNLSGKFEFEVQADIEHEFTINRANGNGYYPIIAGGGNACVLHYNDNDKQLLSGDLLLLDFGAEYANYSADLSRTIPVNGRFTDRQKQCYEAVLKVFKAAIQLYVPGNTIEQINNEVWKMMETEMISLGLFTREDVRDQNPESPLYKRYLMHGVAHHIGLDVHDVGSKYEPLAAGMVLTCEPGLYIREENIGIRIENDILVTDHGPVDLMAEIPVEVADIESIMHRN